MKKLFILSILMVFFMLAVTASALPNPASTYCIEMGYDLVGEMCVFNSNTSCEQWAFYNGECGQNYTHDVECAQAGENSGVAVKCCEGLTSISHSQLTDSGVCAEIMGGYPTCSDCGNGICEEWENECNCGDCKIGDVNSDGKVDSTDALMIQSYVKGLTNFDASQKIKGDVNLDTMITYLDSYIIMMYDVDLIPVLPHVATKYGDVNLDGKVDSTDALIVSTFVETESLSGFKNIANADVNKDGEITKEDADKILQMDVESCYDSDATNMYPEGKNYFEKGVCKDSGGTNPDSCATGSDGSVLLTEYYCNSGKCDVAKDSTTNQYGIKCAYGCKDGACLDEIKCTDSDGGNNINVYGIAEGTNGIEKDTCGLKLETGQISYVSSCKENCGVIEAICNPSGTSTTMPLQGCSYGCKDGACVRYIEENLPPVIDGGSAPTVLKVGERGTWTIKAHDPENGVLSYAVDWGEYYIKNDGTSSITATAQEVSQTSTFTHSYSRAGTYTATFTITDDHQQTAKTSTTVKVEGEVNICSERQKIDITNVRNSNGKISVDYLIGPDINTIEVLFGHSHGGDLRKCELELMSSCGVSSSDPYARCSVTTNCKYPSDSGPYIVTIHDRKCGLSDSFKFGGVIQEKWYRHARWECYDGTVGPGYEDEEVRPPEVGPDSPSITSTSGLTGAVVGILEEKTETAVVMETVQGTSIEIPFICKSYDQWKKEAEEFCRGRCSNIEEQVTKCGVNSFSVWEECYPPIERCADSDGGKNYYEKGTTKSGFGKVETDVCTYCTGLCIEGEPCEMYCGAVIEYFCGREGIEAITYTCPNGCKDGECVLSLHTKCTTDLDCGKPEKTRYCSGDSACVKSSHPQCLNPGTNEAQCSTISTGGCEICRNGCRDGKCIEGKCGNGICEENEICDVDCCENYCQLHCPYGYAEGSCHCKCKEGDDVVCTDSDEGPNYYIPGIAVGPGGSFFSDICDVNGKILQEGICTKEGRVSSSKFECPNGCEKGACVEEGTTTCSGCSYESACLPVGFRRGSQYCDIDHQMKEQKTGTDACDNHHECSSNVCVSGKCVSPSFIDAIISWFTSLFGG